MRIAIYPRKSRFTGQGESVQNQVALCKEYCVRKFSDPEYLVYDEDEGFSGGNTRRPSFQRMMQDAKAKKFDVLICYRLDRISRNVSDFSKTLEELQRYNISFVSLREEFDTSTPMGRAMIYIASVFAQLERETIAERIKDNLHELAKTGRWLGGNTPTGYTAEQVEYTDSMGKKRRQMRLVENREEMALVRMLFDKFVELGSITQLETYCLQNNVTSRLGNDFSRTTLRNLLSNPVYATADASAWEYFCGNDYNLCASEHEFDGAHGVQPFNRTQKMGSITSFKSTSEWIIAVGMHDGAISGAQWVAAQRILEENKSKGYRKPRTQEALLSGLLRCGECGAYMRPKVYGNPLPDGSRRYHYICTLKASSQGKRCHMKNAPGNAIDQMVIDRLTDMVKGKGEFNAKLASDQLFAANEQKALQNAANEQREKAVELQRKIDNLIAKLAEGVPSAVSAQIIAQVETLDAQRKEAEENVQKLQYDSIGALDEADILGAMGNILSRFDGTFCEQGHNEQRQALKAAIEKIEWDGENVEIAIFGVKKRPKA